MKREGDYLVGTQEEIAEHVEKEILFSRPRMIKSLNAALDLFSKLMKLQSDHTGSFGEEYIRVELVVEVLEASLGTKLSEEEQAQVLRDLQDMLFAGNGVSLSMIWPFAMSLDLHVLAPQEKGNLN